MNQLEIEESLLISEVKEIKDPEKAWCKVVAEGNKTEQKLTNNP